MTGYDIRNAMRKAYGIDAADHLFDAEDDKPRDNLSPLTRLFMIIAVALKGVA
jgi:hypothetical protein